ncbi:MAG TPA: glycosyl hydrolase family 28 protein [Phycisphaerae bacterium]|nr:glycosyl hydrolase family 28 protein [Phycisphaerae bacterium]
MASTHAATPRIVTWPGPEGEPSSEQYEVRVSGKPLFVYRAKVRQAIAKPPDSIWTHEMGAEAETVSFAYFDFEGRVEVAVTPRRPFKAATVHPLSAGIRPQVEGATIRFELDRPRKLTILLDGSDREVLHLFAGAPETHRPKPGDPNVLYFGPGIHKTGTIRIKSGQRVYIAGGAVVRGHILPDEKPALSKRSGLKYYSRGILDVRGVSDVRISGRGILDGGLIPHAAKILIMVADASDVRIEGILLRDSPNWAVCLFGSRDVHVSDVRQISGRLNSDGIIPVGCRHIRIRDCFIRNHDDSIAVKTVQPGVKSSDIRVEDCILWNDWGYALGITYETRAPIHDVTFRNCDVLTARLSALGVYLVDSGTVSNITFEDIRVEATCDKLLRVVIGSDMWGTDPERGHIRGVRFKDVCVAGPRVPPSEIAGFDADHRVEYVVFENLRIHGKTIRSAAEGKITINAHTKSILFGWPRPPRRR